MTVLRIGDRVRFGGPIGSFPWGKGTVTEVLKFGVYIQLDSGEVVYLARVSFNKVTKEIAK